MKKKTPFYKLSEESLDSLNRFVKSNNIFSYTINTLINLLRSIGRSIKNIKYLFKPKPTNIIPESTSNKVEVNTSNVIGFKAFKELDLYSNSQEYIMFVDLKREEGDTSGALDYAQNKIMELEKQYNAKTINVCYQRFTDNWFINLNNSIDILLNSLQDLDFFFVTKKIKLVFINNMIFNNDIETLISTICDFKKKYEFNLEYAFHDYLSICPSNFLISSDGEPCNQDNCDDCLIKNNCRSIVRNDIKVWRDMFSNFFECVNKVLFFSNYTKEVVLNIYPILKDKYEIIPHKILMAKDATKYDRPRINKEINIAFVGYFHHIKGSDYFIDVIEKLKKNYAISAYIIGYLESGTENDFRYNYKITGKYNRNDLGKILTENNINLVIYPSINSETYSYIVQELMELDVPFAVFRRGAPAERIENQNYDLAEIADEVSVDSMYNAVIKLIKRLGLNQYEKN